MSLAAEKLNDNALSAADFLVSCMNNEELPLKFRTEIAAEILDRSVGKPRIAGTQTENDDKFEVEIRILDENEGFLDENAGIERIPLEYSDMQGAEGTQTAFEG